MENITGVPSMSSGVSTSVILNPLPEYVVIIRSVFLGIIIGLALSGNFLVCFTLYRRQYLLMPSNKLVLSLTFSNFLFSILVLPFVLTSSIQKHWLLGSVWCSLTGLITQTVLGASLLTLSIISCDRYYAIVYPFQYPVDVTGFRVTCVIILCWIISGACAIPPLFGAWSKYHFYPAHMGCIPHWGLSRAYSLFWLIFFFILPFCIMVFCYACIFKAVRRKTRQNRVNNFSIDQLHPKMNNFFLGDDGVEDNDGMDSSDQVHSKQITGKGIATDDRDCCNVSVTRDSGIVSGVQGEDNCGVVDDDDDGSILPHQVVYSSMNCKLQQDGHTGCRSGNNNNLKSSFIRSHLGLPEMYDVIPTAVTAVVHQNPSFDKPVNNRVSSDCCYEKHIQTKTNCSSSFNHLEEQDAMTVLSTGRKLPAFEQNGTATTSRNTSLFASGNSLGSLTRDSEMSMQPPVQPKQLTYSHVHYYKNHKKAICTIIFVVGILLLTTVPYLVVSIYETFHAISTEISYYPGVPDWIISTVTICLYCTCIYYPLIYGLWNHTVRKEIKSLLFGESKHPKTPPQTILTLMTHFKDLGLSPRLTAAIMAESAAVASIVRPTHVVPMSSKKRGGISYSSNRVSTNNGKRNTTSKDKPSLVSQTGECSRGTRNGNISEYTMRLKTKEEIGNLNFNQNNCKSRDREKPGQSLLKLNSDEILTNDILLPALLLSNTETNDSVCFSKYSRTLGNVHSMELLDLSKKYNFSESIEKLSSDEFDSESETMSVNEVFAVTNYKGSQSCCFNNILPKSIQENDIAPLLEEIQEKMQSSNLIHLEAGEPVKIRRWNKPQMYDYFAQTMAYDLVENVISE
ncbi:unnamed protein product [Clavelina lepadiformis]|uniref:G-protein coupled receptors family 1 profile domain-containing protein n=1 Tax=Clavelina lepadiformis TaxID=159417 RepID=A0ABP0GFS2_CLALP